jgi:hypothetical protein
MDRRALAAARPLSFAALLLLAPAAPAQDPGHARREQAVDRRELQQDRQALRDDRRDLARVEALQGRLEALRSGRHSPNAVAAFDAEVERALGAEWMEGRQELQRDTMQVRRDQAEVRGDARQERQAAMAGDARGATAARHERMDDRRELADDARDRQVETAQLQRVQALRRAWAELRGRYGPPAMERRRALLADFAAQARAELRGDQRELQDDRRELREDRRDAQGGRR